MQTPSPVARRVLRRGAWAASAGGVVCLVLAALSWFVLALAFDLGVYEWPPSSVALSVDGHEHRLHLPAHQSTTLWAYDGDNTPSCRFTDAGSSTPLRLSSPARDYYRPAGSNGYRGLHVLDSGSGAVLASCSARGATSPVYVERTPRLPPWVDGLGLRALVPVTFALAGAALVAWGVVTGVRCRRRAVGAAS